MSHPAASPHGAPLSVLTYSAGLTHPAAFAVGMPSPPPLSAMSSDGKDDPYERKPMHQPDPTNADKKKRPARSLVVPLLHIKDTERRLVIGMVGLPARGKTYISKKITRYLSWLGYKTRVFNVGDYRRKIAGADQASGFFDPENKEGSRIRDEVAILALKDLVEWFSQGGQAAIYDATNSTKERRKMVSQFLAESPFSGELMWIESICNDRSIIEANIRDTKLFSPDYVGKDPEAATQDFMRRIHMYEKTYQPVEDDELGPEDSYVKLIDTGKKVTTNSIRGYLPGRIVFFLMNIQIQKKPIWISRHGESEYNVLGKIGGDSGLSPLGAAYAVRLGEWVSTLPELQDLANEPATPSARTISSPSATNGMTKVSSTGNIQERGVDDSKKLSVWCSVLQRTQLTAAEVKKRNEDKIIGKVVEWRGLTEIDAGIYDGLTYPEVEKRDPVGYAQRDTDKLRYRYPQGESYVDVIERLEAVIFELERAKGPVLVIGHQAVLRCLYGYFLDTPLNEIPFLDIPLHTVIKLIPKAYRCVEERYTLMPTTSKHGVPRQLSQAGVMYVPAHPPQIHSPVAQSPVELSSRATNGQIDQLYVSTPSPSSSTSSSASSADTPDAAPAITSMSSPMSTGLNIQNA